MRSLDLTGRFATPALTRLPRYRAARRRDTRIATVAAGATLALGMVGDAVLVDHPSSYGIWPNVIAAALALGVMGLVRGPLRARPEAGAFALGSIAVSSTLVAMVLTSSEGVQYLTLSYITLIVLAMATFMPWDNRHHIAWLATSAATVLLLALTPVGATLAPTFREHIVPGTVAALIASVAGHALLQRQRLQVFTSEQQVRLLHHRSRASEIELLRLNLALETVSRLDPLTGVGNRLRLEEDMRVLRARLARRGGRGAVVLLDIDRFKRYNDTFGHLAGDAALRAVAGALRDAVRTEDGVYRFGGEEFLLLLSDTSDEQASATVERLHRVVDDLALRHPQNKPWGSSRSAPVLRRSSSIEMRTNGCAAPTRPCTWQRPPAGTRLRSPRWCVGLRPCKAVHAAPRRLVDQGSTSRSPIPVERVFHLLDCDVLEVRLQLPGMCGFDRIDSRRTRAEVPSGLVKRRQKEVPGNRQPALALAA